MARLQLLVLIVCVSTLALVTSAATVNSRAKRSTLTEEAERLIKQANNVNVNDVGQLLGLVEKNKAEDCLARVICELSNNSQSHGEAGSKFAQSLLKFRQSKHPKVKFYIDAMSLGTKARGANECKSSYSKCSYQTSEVIAVGNRLLRTK